MHCNSLLIVFALLLVASSSALLAERIDGPLFFKNEPSWSPPHIGCVGNFGLMNAYTIPKHSSFDPLTHPIKVSIYRIGFHDVCPDPKNEAMVRAYEDAHRNGKIQISEIVYLSEFEYENDKVWQYGKGPMRLTTEEKNELSNDGDMVTFSPMTRECALVSLWFGTTLPIPIISSPQTHYKPVMDLAQKLLSESTCVEAFLGKPIMTDFVDFPRLHSTLYDHFAGQKGIMADIAARTGPWCDVPKEIDVETRVMLLSPLSTSKSDTSEATLDDICSAQHCHTD